MATKADLANWIVEVLRAKGGKAHHIVIAKEIWRRYEDELKSSPKDLFYTWQYDLRWAAKKLRDKDILRPAIDTPQGVWCLNH